ncbi:hypothetical protein DUZ99_13255 [Xylanibacillus composti]|uniref:O-antigen ligase-related domain-containing protein n=1 Tax=Xylanibacillus composti TaxID=1572762 RepID=A0A8J4M4K1_9BACL|nr:O-antigen ligase family protein [Xylanibacillus composti]MDT9725942.1 hypothetical protein [Xylanibacillus composti]GIQ71255.1 hypothetical protein XYCOK13_40790 [Xylanibacillus composti]
MVKGNMQEEKAHQSFLFWLILSFALAFIFIAPFYKGLFNGNSFFFERPIYTAVMWGSVALIIVSIYLFTKWKLQNHRDILAIAVWFIPICYLLSMMNATSKHLASIELYIQILCAIFFLIGAYFTSNNAVTVILRYGIVVSGYVVVIYGWMNWFGNAEYQDAVLNGRMAGVFQYPNTYAAFMTSILMISLLYLLKARKWYEIVPHALMIFPIIFSFVLTLSRGGYATFGIILILFLFLFQWKKQLLILVYVFMSFGTSLIFYNPIVLIHEKVQSESSQSSSIEGWSILIGISIVFACLICAFQIMFFRKWEKNNSELIVRWGKNWVIPTLLLFGVIIVGLIIFTFGSISGLFPDNIQKRLDGFSNIAIKEDARLTYIKDATEIIQDSPILGAGGGAWTRLYSQYQSYPYTSNQTHTFYMKYLIETGILGFLVFMCVVGYVFIVFFKNYYKESLDENNRLQWVFPSFALPILFHSAIDFDMSFVYLSVMIFFCLGVMVSRDNSNLLQTANINKISRFNLIFPSTMLILAVVVFVNTSLSVRANQLFSQSVETAKTSQNYNEIIKPLDQALKLKGNNPEYNLFKINMLQQLYAQTKDEQFANEASNLLQNVRKVDRYNLQMIHQQYNLYIASGKYDQAIEWIDGHLEYFPWDETLYKIAIQLHLELGDHARRDGENLKQRYYWDKVEGYVGKLRGLYEDNQMPENIMRGYNYNTKLEMGLTLGKVFYLDGRYPEAIEVLKEVRVSNFFENYINREIARWYLASLYKIGEKNDELYNKLIEEYPEERLEIQLILEEQL